MPAWRTTTGIPCQRALRVNPNGRPKTSTILEHNSFLNQLEKILMPRFILEQLALHPQDPEAAISFLSEIGMADWARDHVKARGMVKGWDCHNEADLAFSYTSGAGAEKPMELEVLHYTDGANWMHGQNRASHIAMHVDAGELAEWRAFMLRKGIGVVQEVNTYSHTNPVIAGKREYNYVIFDTHALLSVDMKFILRRDIAG